MENMNRLFSYKLTHNKNRSIVIVIDEFAGRKQKSQIVNISVTDGDDLLKLEIPCSEFTYSMTKRV